MDREDLLRGDLEAAIAGPGDRASAVDRLCEACVDLLQIDGAAVSVVHRGVSRGTFGSSGELSRRLDEFQFTYGEGPCLDAVAGGHPVLVSDIGEKAEQRWPAYSLAVLDVGVRSVFALPVAIAETHVGVLDLFRHAPGPLSIDSLRGGLLAAKLVAGPLFDVLNDHVDDGISSGDEFFATPTTSLQRIEVYQATGMLMEHLDVDVTEAMARLRGHAFATGQTASQVAWAVVERRLLLDRDDVTGFGADSAERP